MMNMHNDGQTTTVGATPEPPDQEHTLPLVGGMIRPDQPAGDATVEPERTGMTGRGSLLLLLVFVIALGTLYLMRRSQGEARITIAQSELEAKIDLALAAHVAQNSAEDGGDSVAGLIAADPAQNQVPLQYVQRNPFVMPVVRQPDPLRRESQPPASAAVISTPQADPLDGLKQQVAAMRLEAVIQGSFPMAIINGQMLKPGQSIGNLRIKTITERTVILEHNQHQFTLRMED